MTHAIFSSLGFAAQDFEMAIEKPVEAGQRFFTADEANKALPLVKVIVGDIVRQFEVVNERKQLLIHLKNLRRRPGGSTEAHGDEVREAQTNLETEETQLDDYLGELSRLGVKLKGFDGLCDFPSLRDGREVYLCWRLGEPSVRFWHEVNAGFAGRQPIDPRAVADQRQS